jgi:hypothetical protein
MLQRSTMAALLSLAILAGSADVQAAKPKPAKHYHRGSFAEYILVPRQNQTTVRQVYSGYSSHLPPPAVLYYGYPWAEKSYGPGF